MIINKLYYKYLPIILLALLDFVSVSLSVYLSAASIHNEFLPFLNIFVYYSVSLFFVVFVINFYLKNYSYLNRSFNLDNIKNILLASIFIFISIYFLKIIMEFFKIKVFFYDSYFFSIRNIINQVVLIASFLIMTRLFAHVMSHLLVYKKNKKNEYYQNFAIYGAGRSGLSFLENLKIKSIPKPKYIIDDNPAKIGRFIESTKIISFGEFEKIISTKSTNIKKIILCIPSLDSIDTDKIKKKITDLNIEIESQDNRNNEGHNLSKIIKNISDNSQNINENINENIKPFFEDKVVLVTGAGGSIGKEICYKISKFKIKKLIAIDIDEYRLSIINRELLNNNPELVNKYHNYLLDINNYQMLSEIFKLHKPDLVYHAAASKHVDLVENNWFYASLNNIESTYNVCKCSILTKVKKTIFISTDKAVDPINFLGLSKSVGEKIIKFFGLTGKDSHFSIVRFGNVVGSSGSLLDSIKHQLEISNVINVTDKNMTRYFMTISDAVNLVLISTKISKNGDCHVLKMGEAVKIIDIINSIVDQHNAYRSLEKPEIKIKFTGKRAGEKLHEKLFDEEKIESTENKYILNERKPLINKNLGVSEFMKEIKIFSNDKIEFKKILDKFISNTNG